MTAAMAPAAGVLPQAAGPRVQTQGQQGKHLPRCGVPGLRVGVHALGPRRPAATTLQASAASSSGRVSAQLRPSAFFRELTKPFTSQPPRPSATQLARLEEEPQSLGWECFDAGKYSILEELGKGSFGRVSEAINKETGQRVAIKKMNKIRQNQKPARTAIKLQREIDLLQRVQGTTKHVVQKLGAYEDDLHVYLITEVLSGGTVEELLAVRGGRLAEDEACWILAEVLDFIATCHENSIVYADAKPANFMLDHSGAGWTIKAIDMGCSQPVRAGQRLEMRSGTPLYFAPEVFQRSYGQEADMWSVGVMLYLLLTGKNPWFQSLKGVSADDVMKKVLAEPVPYEDEHWAGLSPEVKDLVQSMLTTDPHSRISARHALAHPWLSRGLQRQEQLAEDPTYANNVVPVTDRKLAGLAITRQQQTVH